MVMLVRERRLEIGVPKAIGARNRTNGLQFVLEALVLVALGSAAGAAVASSVSASASPGVIAAGVAATDPPAGIAANSQRSPSFGVLTRGLPPRVRR